MGHVFINIHEADDRLLAPSGPDDARAVMADVKGSAVVTDDDAVASATAFQFGESVENDAGTVGVVGDSTFAVCSL